MAATFGEQMRALMSERGLSLRRLAKIVNYDVGYLSKVQNGKKPPSPQLVTRLDHALGANGKLAAHATPPSAKPAAPPAETARNGHSQWPLATAVRSIRDDLRDDAKLLHARAHQLALAGQPLRAAFCRGHAIACQNAAEHLAAALTQSQSPRGTPPPAPGNLSARSQTALDKGVMPGEPPDPDPPAENPTAGITTTSPVPPVGDRNPLEKQRRPARPVDDVDSRQGMA